MRTVTPQEPISLDELRRLAAERFGDLVKAVVDLERRIMIVDAELHADQEAELLAGGSRQQDLWGINFYPDLAESDWLELDSMINIQPFLRQSVPWRRRSRDAGEDCRPGARAGATMTDMKHGEMAAGRWWTLTLAEQLGNVGSEISRTLKWRTRNPQIAQRAMARALELIDLTLDDPRHRSSVARLREICRVREVVLDFLAGPNQYGSTEVTLQRYFDAFAVTAAKRR